jgi:hypothetical protein
MAVREVIPDNQIESDLEDTIVVDPSLYYQTPEHTPVRPGALLAIAIRNAGQPLINSQSLAQGEVLQEDYTNLSTNPCSSNTKYGNWRTVFNSGRLVQPLSKGREKVTKATLARVTRGTTALQEPALEHLVSS